MNEGLPLIPRWFEPFIKKWASKRQTSTQLEVTIHRRQLYILPTRHGLTYFIILLLILFAAINYENSLAFMLAFLLGSLGSLGMIYTHQNINQITIRAGQAQSVFFGQDILLPITLSQKIKQLRPALVLSSESGQQCHCELNNSLQTEYTLAISSNARGYQTIKNIRLFSEYPLGLFHAWSWLNLNSRCLIYPKPSTHHYNFNSHEENSSEQSRKNKPGFDDFAGIRLYTDGDPPNHMAWKAIAKTGTLQTKLFNREVSEEVWINWSHTSDLHNTEQRLSILCRMVLDASENNIQFGLQLPNKKITPSTGLTHKHHCLKALALFGYNT